jgi:hypothetical protein
MTGRTQYRSTLIITNHSRYEQICWKLPAAVLNIQVEYRVRPGGSGMREAIPWVVPSSPARLG